MLDLLRSSGTQKYYTSDGNTSRRPNNPVPNATEAVKRKTYKYQEEWDIGESRALIYIINNVNQLIKWTLYDSKYNRPIDKQEYLKRYNKTGYVKTYTALIDTFNITAKGKLVKDFYI